jgi:small-conductance mechanosensitive channel
MSIQPIDLQTLFVRLSQIGREQSALKQAIAQNQAVTGSEIAQRSQDAGHTVRETSEVSEGPEMVNEEETNQTGEHGRGGVIQSLNNAGDQNISLIEDRIKSLKNLLNRADTQIDEMEARLRQIEDRRAESDEAHGGDEVAPSATEEEPTYTLQLQRPPERIGAGDGAEYIPANDVSDAIDDGVDRLDPRDQVRRLHSQGLWRSAKWS